MSKPLCLALSLLLVSPLCTAEVYKCIKDGGRTVYQNFPCPIDSIGSEATQPPPMAPAMPSKAVEAGRKGEDAPVPTKPAAPDGEPRPGMTAAEVRASSWGDPWTIYSTGDQKAGDPKGRGEIWSYGETRTVVFNSKGRVASVVTPQP